MKTRVRYIKTRVHYMKTRVRYMKTRVRYMKRRVLLNTSRSQPNFRILAWKSLTNSVLLILLPRNIGAVRKAKS